MTEKKEWPQIVAIMVGAGLIIWLCWGVAARWLSGMPWIQQAMKPAMIGHGVGLLLVFVSYLMEKRWPEKSYRLNLIGWAIVVAAYSFQRAAMIAS